MADFFIKEIVDNNIEKELSQIGFDEGYRFIASDKFRYKNIKIYNLTPEQANIIKQTALSVGADCATHREVIRGNIDKSNAILGGSYSQIKKISDKLQHQPFHLKILGEIFLNNLKSQTRKTKLVGVLNVTPNSFSDGGKYLDPESAKKHLIQLIEDCADIIDIGAESTKPYSEPVEPDEQINRLKPVLEFIKQEKITTPISIDTRSSKVAEFVLDYGAAFINDVSGFDYDKNMPNVVAKYDTNIIIQHSKGTPLNMQDLPEYNNVVEEIYLNLKEKIEYAESVGIKNIIIDPGIGFGKTKENNFEILNRIEEFHSLQKPIMVGVSRKSLLGITESDNNLKDSLSLAIAYPLVNKVDYLRVHNIKLHKEMIRMLETN